MWGRLVAAITSTRSRLSKPSIDVSSWFTIRSVTPLELCSPRRGAIESISSMKTMEGEA